MLNALEEHSSATVHRKSQRQFEGAVCTKSSYCPGASIWGRQRADPTSILPHATTPTMKSVQNLLRDVGLLRWRFHATGMDVVSTNDVDLEAGNFIKYQFIHLYSRAPEDSEAVYFSTSSMHSTVLRMEKVKNGNACCHIRCFNDHLIK